MSYRAVSFIDASSLFFFVPENPCDELISISYSSHDVGAYREARTLKGIRALVAIPLFFFFVSSMAYLSSFSYKKSSFLDKLHDYLTSVLFFAHDTEIVRLYFVADVLSAFFSFTSIEFPSFLIDVTITLRYSSYSPFVSMFSLLFNKSFTITLCLFTLIMLIHSISMSLIATITGRVTFFKKFHELSRINASRRVRDDAHGEKIDAIASARMYAINIR